MSRGRAVHPDCPNASNPFHICAEYCAHGSVRLETPASKEITEVPNGVGKKETEPKVGGGKRSVDPLCVNASNPFHQCSDYCVRRSRDTKPASREFKADGLKEKIAAGDNRKVDSSCPNASNPFHQCAEYCSQRSAGQHKQGNSAVGAAVGNSRGSTKVLERKDVNPGCVNASNPFHKCAEYCSQNRRINGVVQPNR